MFKSIQRNILRFALVIAVAVSLIGTTITSTAYASDDCSTTGSSHCGG